MNIQRMKQRGKNWKLRFAYFYPKFVSHQYYIINNNLLLSQISQLEADLIESQANSAHLEKQESLMKEKEKQLLAMQRETNTLKEALQKEELEKLRKEQSIQELKKKVKNLESHQHGLEILIKEKQEMEIDSDQRLKRLKQKVHKLSEKVIAFTPFLQVYTDNIIIYSAPFMRFAQIK